MIESDAAYVVRDGLETELGRFGSLGAGAFGLRISTGGSVEIGDVAGGGNSLEWDGTDLTIVGSLSVAGTIDDSTMELEGGYLSIKNASATEPLELAWFWWKEDENRPNWDTGGLPFQPKELWLGKGQHPDL